MRHLLVLAVVATLEGCLGPGEPFLVMGIVFATLDDASLSHGFTLSVVTTLPDTSDVVSLFTDPATLVSFV